MLVPQPAGTTLAQVDVCPPPLKLHKSNVLARMPMQITSATLVSGFSLGRLSKVEGNWTKELLAHMAAFKAG